MSGRRSLRAPLLAGHGPLARVPPLAAFVVVAALFTVAVVVRGPVGAALLALLTLGVIVLLAGTWRALSPGQRVGRVLVIGVLALIAASVLNS